MAPAASIETVVEDAAVLVTVTGELDLANVGEFEDELVAAVTHQHDGRVVMVDLTDCTYLDSAALNALFRVAASHQLAVVAGNPTLLALFELTKLDTVVTIRSTRVLE
jgi:anti-anti-sigma factor